MEYLLKLGYMYVLEDDVVSTHAHTAIYVYIST